MKNEKRKTKDGEMVDKRRWNGCFLGGGFRTICEIVVQIVKFTTCP